MPVIIPGNPPEPAPGVEKGADLTPTPRQVAAAMRLFAPREGPNMRSKVVHDRLEQAGTACDETSLNEAAERMLIEMTREPVDKDDPPPRVPVLAEPAADTTDGDDHA